jgi:hypothetical protein
MTINDPNSTFYENASFRRGIAEAFALPGFCVDGLVVRHRRFGTTSVLSAAVKQSKQISEGRMDQVFNFVSTNS